MQVNKTPRLQTLDLILANVQEVTLICTGSDNSLSNVRNEIRGHKDHGLRFTRIKVQVVVSKPVINP